MELHKNSEENLHVTSHGGNDVSFFGRVLVENGKLTNIQLEKVLKHQHQKNIKFGEAALELGFIMQSDIDAALAKQFEYSFIDTETTGISSTLYMAFNKNFSEKEKIKGLRSQININWLMHGNKGVLIAGTDGDDSVAVLSANLAIAFSQSGKRTLLVDANMRDSTLHNYFSIKNKQGLSDVLAERSSIHDALHTVKPLANLYFLPSGTQVLNPQELMSRDTLEAVCNEVSQQFDVVIYNTPSQVDYFDGQILSSRVSGVVLVAKENETSIQSMQTLLNRLRITQATVLGCVYTRD